jgi:Putative Ig domain
MRNRIKIALLSLALIGLIVSASCTPSKTPTITTNSLPEGTEGQAYLQTLQAHGGTPPYTWFAMATLPPGLQLDPLTGVISGTPMAGWGPAFVPFNVADHTGIGSEKQLLITVNPTTTTTSSTTITNFNDVNTASSKPASGLSLSLSLDGTTYQPGQEVSIAVDEKNTLSTTNNVTATDNLPSEFMSGFTNDPSPLPFGIAVLQGNYDVSNYSKVTPLIIYDPMEVYIGFPVAPPTSYSFQPLSDTAILNGGDYKLVSGMKMQYEIGVQQYWPNNDGADFTHFQSGVYTVVAGDEWGALVIVHFTVTN